VNVLILRGAILIHDDIGMVTYEDLMAHVLTASLMVVLSEELCSQQRRSLYMLYVRMDQVVELLERPLSEHATPEEVANRQQNLEDVRAILPLLEAGLDVNVKFTRYDAFNLNSVQVDAANLA